MVIDLALIVESEISPLILYGIANSLELISLYNIVVNISNPLAKSNIFVG